MVKPSPSNLVRTLTGQAFAGSTCATLLSGSCLAAGWMTEPGAVILGSFGGALVEIEQCSVQNLGWLFDIGDEILPNYMGIILVGFF